jgi:hypothetical protein
MPEDVVITRISRSDARKGERKKRTRSYKLLPRGVVALVTDSGRRPLDGYPPCSLNVVVVRDLSWACWLWGIVIPLDSIDLLSQAWRKEVHEIVAYIIY